MNGKGSKRRPMKVPKKQFDKAWERIFGKNNKINKLHEDS